MPGVALAVARPDLDVHLVEPMLRRTEWLIDTVAELGLDSVTVHRGRAEEFQGRLRRAFVTARAVARLDKLARWCVPLLEAGGTLVAMKGTVRRTSSRRTGGRWSASGSSLPPSAPTAPGCSRSPR